MWLIPIFDYLYPLINTHGFSQKISRQIWHLISTGSNCFELFLASLVTSLNFFINCAFWNTWELKWVKWASLSGTWGQVGVFKWYLRPLISTWDLDWQLYLSQVFQGAQFTTTIHHATYILLLKIKIWNLSVQ